MGTGRFGYIPLGALRFLGGKTMINAKWHLANKMPKNPSFDERLDGHVAHQKNCSCRALPPKLAEEIRRRKKK